MWFVFPHIAFSRVETTHTACSFELLLKRLVLEIYLQSHWSLNKEWMHHKSNTFNYIKYFFAYDFKWISVQQK